MQTIDQLFVAELKDTLGAEQTVAAALERLTQCQSDPQLQRTFGAHLAETRAQMDRLQQVLSTLGESPTPTLCEGIQGIVDEHSAFVLKHSPSPQVHAAFDVGAAQKVEHYEIATYEHLVGLADRLGYRQIAQLLGASLTEERRQLERLGNIDLVEPVPAQQQQAVQQQTTGGQPGAAPQQSTSGQPGSVPQQASGQPPQSQFGQQ